MPSPSAASPAPALGGDLEALVAAATAGDGGAWRRLFERFAPLVHGVVLARVPPRDADDLVQDVFVRALQKLGDLREGAAFGAWVAAIARRRAADFHRSRRDEAELSDDLGTADPDVSAAEQVLRAIRSLPEAYHEPLVLRLVEGLSGPEIAEQTGLTAASVRVNLHRGMKQLRQRLGLGEGDG